MPRPFSEAVRSGGEDAPDGKVKRVKEAEETKKRRGSGRRRRPTLTEAGDQAGRKTYRVGQPEKLHARRERFPRTAFHKRFKTKKQVKLQVEQITDGTDTTGVNHVEAAESTSISLPDGKDLSALKPAVGAPHAASLEEIKSTEERGDATEERENRMLSPTLNPTDHSAHLKEPKRDTGLYLDKLADVPENEPLQPVSESDFNPRYIEATKAILTDFSDKRPELHLDPDTLLREYISQYGIVTEQDHVDCLKLAMKECLKHAREGKKILILSDKNTVNKRSERLMSNALYSLLSGVVDEDAVEIIYDTHKSEYAIRDAVTEVFNRDKRPAEDYRFVVIDDAAYSGVNFYGHMQRISWNIKGFVQNPERSIDGFIGYDKSGENVYAQAEGYSVYTVRRAPDPIPVEQLPYFNNYLFGSRPSERDSSIIPQAIVTAYKDPDDHSVHGYSKRWGFDLYSDVADYVQKGHLRSMAELLVSKGILTAETDKIKAFGEKRYPSSDHLVSLVTDQLGL